jgi:hypothetical protein
VIARLGAIAMAAIALNGLAGVETRVMWLNGCWAAAAALLVARVWLGRETPGLRLADLSVNVCGMLILGHIALVTPGTASALRSPASELVVALVFATTLTSAIVRLGLLLDGRRATIGLIDA